MSIAQKLINVSNVIKKINNARWSNYAQLITVTKNHPILSLLEVYEAGCKTFGENKVQEMVEKQEKLPADIQWHLIGHLQTNKVKYIASFVAMIHSIDSLKLLAEVNKQAEKNNRIIDCLLQIFIATEETKFGLSPAEATELLQSPELSALKHIRIMGLMGMASFSDDEQQIRAEFHGLKQLFETFKVLPNLPENVHLTELSMGMSHDYTIAIEEGATLLRIGSAILGNR